MVKKFYKKYRNTLKLNDSGWINIKEFFEYNFDAIKAIITLKNGAGVVEEKLPYVYGYVKSNFDKIDNFQLSGERKGQKITMTFFASRQTSRNSLKILGENLDRYTKEKIKKFSFSIGSGALALNKKFFTLFIVYIIGTSIDVTTVKIAAENKEWLVFFAGAAFIVLLFLLYNITAFGFPKKKNNQLIEILTKEETDEIYRNVLNRKPWRYVMMSIVALLPYAGLAIWIMLFSPF